MTSTTLLYSSLNYSVNINSSLGGNLSSSSSLFPAHTIHIHIFPFIIKGMLMCLIIVTAILGNLLVIISVIKHRKLRIITNYFVVSLAFADLLVALCVMPFNAIVSLTDEWYFGYLMCDVWNSFDVYFSTASILHLCCISVDRYYAIVKPLQYHTIMNHNTVLLMLSNVWILPGIISFTPIMLGWYTTSDHKQFRKHHPNVCIFVVNVYYALISSSISFWIPGFVMVTMYYRIYKEAVRQRIALSRTSSNIVLNSIHQHRQQHPHYQHRLHPSDGDIHFTFNAHAHSNATNNATRLHPGDEDVNYAANAHSNRRDSNAQARRDSNANRLHPGDEDVNYAPNAHSNRRDSNAQARRDSNAHWLHPSDGDLNLGASNNGLSSRSTSDGSAVVTFSDTPQTTPIPRNARAHSVTLNVNGGSSPVTLRQTSTSWRTEHKAARTLGIIMGVFLICWLPFFLWYLISTLCGTPCDCPEYVVTILFWIGYFNSVLNPLMYAYFNRDFREAFKNTLSIVFPWCFSCFKNAHTLSYV